MRTMHRLRRFTGEFPATNPRWNVVDLRSDCFLGLFVRFFLGGGLGLVGFGWVWLGLVLRRSSEASALFAMQMAARPRL